jgi:hypothetical protein
MGVDHRLVLAGGQRRVGAGRPGVGRLVDRLLPRVAELRRAFDDRLAVQTCAVNARRTATSLAAPRERIFSDVGGIKALPERTSPLGSHRSSPPRVTTERASPP